MKIFCLPSAGAQASIYNALKRALENEIQIIPIEYPGHGVRMGEPLINTMEGLCTACMKAVESSLEYQDEPFAVLGHSMGGMLGCQMEGRLVEKKRNIKKLILCACLPPDVWIDFIPDIGNMSDSELIKYASMLGGIPEELADNAFFKEVYARIMRNDFLLIKNYIPDISFISTPVVSINGTKDDLVGRRWKSWERFAKSEISFYELEENHFLIKNTNEICTILRKELDSLRDF